MVLDVFSLSRHGGTALPDDFVHWPHYLEVFAADDVNRHEFIAALARLLNSMQHEGLRVVASGDFESELAAARAKNP